MKETKFLKGNPFSRAFIVLLASKQSKDLVNGSTVDTGDSLSSFNKKEYHHVFPDGFLRSKQVDSSKRSSLCNFCILPSASNKIISDKAPSDYFTNIVPQGQFIDILESNLLPAKKEIYRDDNYESFLSERTEEIIALIDSNLR